MTKRGKGFGPPLNNISETIGNTPMVKISDCISPEGQTIYAQCKFFNLLSSVKDRLALSISRQQERRLSEAMPDGCQGYVWKYWHRPEICNNLKGMNFDYWLIKEIFIVFYKLDCCLIFIFVHTIAEAGKYIKEHSPGTKIILAEPGASNLIGSGIKTTRNDSHTPAFSHRAFKPHLIQGWTAIQTSLALAKNEGVLTGISGGATMWAAVKTAMNAPEGSVIVAMLPDTNERYLSAPLFSENLEEMNEEEPEIARAPLAGFLKVEYF
ncbi:hypothetical protein ACHAW6_009330 [Cyclotella cf. meneghiniana]